MAPDIYKTVDNCKNLSVMTRIETFAAAQIAQRLYVHKFQRIIQVVSRKEGEGWEIR